MDPNLPFQPPPVEPIQPVQPLVPPMPPMESTPVLPPPTKKSNWVLILGIVLLLVSVLALVGYYLYQSNQSRVSVPTPTPLALASPTATLDPTADWKTYTSSDFVYPNNNVYTGYSFLFPQTCIQKLESLTCNFTHGTGTIMINAGGHGGNNIEIKVIKSNETKIIPVGEGKITEIEDIKNQTVFGTFWINKTDKLELSPIFGFEFRDIPNDDLSEFEKLFDQILSTFQFTATQSTSSSTPSATPI